MIFTRLLIGLMAFPVVLILSSCESLIDAQIYTRYVLVPEFTNCAIHGPLCPRRQSEAKPSDTTFLYTEGH